MISERQLTVRLNEELAAVRTELSRLDGKCATLCGLAGAALAFVTTQTGHGPILARSLILTAGAALAVAAVVLLTAVLRPRLGPTGFCRYTTMSAAEICALMTGHAYDTNNDRAGDLAVLSTIAHRKNRRLRLAVDLIAVAVALVAMAMPAALCS